MPHCIRLRRPWSCSFETGWLHFRRKFNRPTGLDDRSTVTCCVRISDAELLTATFNGKELDLSSEREAAVQRWEISHLLRLANEMELNVRIGGLTQADVDEAKLQQPPGEVWLEIT